MKLPTFWKHIFARKLLEKQGRTEQKQQEMGSEKALKILGSNLTVQDVIITFEECFDK